MLKLIVTPEQPSKLNVGGHNEVRFSVDDEVLLYCDKQAGWLCSLGFFKFPGLFSSELVCPFVAEFNTFETDLHKFFYRIILHQDSYVQY